MANVLVLASLLAILLSPLAGQTKWAGDGKVAPRVGVLLEFEHDPPLAALHAMEREVGAMLDATGAAFSWLTKKNTPPQTFDQVAVMHFRGNCRIEKVGFPVEDTGQAMTLGATDVISGHVTSYSSVECDHIKTCIAGLIEDSCARDRETAFSRALGRVVAHELYHILASTKEHTHSGVAKAIQTPFDLIRENYQFDRQALLRLRDRLLAQLEAKKDRAQDLDPERGVPAI